MMRMESLCLLASAAASTSGSIGAWGCVSGFCTGFTQTQRQHLSTLSDWCRMPCQMMLSAQGLQVKALSQKNIIKWQQDS